MPAIPSFLPRLLAVCACACVCLPALAHAAAQDSAASSEPAASPASSAARPAGAQPFVGDDALAVRDALAKAKLDTGKPSLKEHAREWLHAVARQPTDEPALKPLGLDRTLRFVIPVSYGLLYRAKRHQLSVDLDLSSEATPDTILLRKAITGPRGRRLVVAAEAKAKGYVQHIDIIEMDPGKARQTAVRARVSVAPSDFDAAGDDGGFAIVLLAELAPPYLSERSEHSDPSNEEPTDITTRTSTLHAQVQAVWLVNTKTGAVLTRKLRLSSSK
ncbi:hypothetical protein [Burkholderia gladioli]|uniref:hypothetical protein n=1 Tax=Burkholderia gladioli TaxID=28095 RepID=UPI001D11C270|nr:hypothetical protein [Burkholderia gladioli]